jgi:hypothetical protein
MSYDFMGMSRAPSLLDSSAMGKRILTGVFWFLAFAYFFQFAGAMYGFPTALGTVLALGIGVIMTVAPFGALWKPQPTRRIARIPDRAVPGDGRRAHLPGG